MEVWGYGSMGVWELPFPDMIAYPFYLTPSPCPAKEGEQAGAYSIS